MRERLTYATLVGLVAYSAIATDLYLPGISAMVADFGVSEADGQLTLSTFMIGIAFGQLIFGPLSDYYGRLPMVTIGTLLFVGTSLACAFAPSIEFMWLMRALQGVAAASGPVIARAMVRDRYHGNRAAQVMASLGAAMAVVPLIAPTIGAWVLLWFDWPATFIALCVFALCVMAGLGLFEESAPRIRQGEIRILIVFKRLVTYYHDRRFVGYQMCGSASFAGIFAYLSTVSFFMYDVFDIATENFGYAFAVSVFGFMVGSLLSSRVVMRVGADKTMAVGCSISATAAATLWLTAMQTDLHVVMLAVSSMFVFLGIGLSFANATMGAVSLFPETAGSASAAYGFVHAVTSALVGYIAGIAYDGSLVPTTTIMLCCALVALAGLWFARPHADSA